jgi:UDP-N-acetylglucosamine--N-acetylmuramyl-(pentapeptide) pyrophosphoryl-undecaprenol N-acetylglucosamine transferase
LTVCNWQTGRNDYHSLKDELEALNIKNVWCSDFISRMDYAYTVADLVISRAGAGTLSELCLLKKASILVPSPNVAEDHQTKNALALSDYEAAVHISDRDAEAQLIPAAIELLKDKERLSSLSEHIALFAQYNSAGRIVDEVVKIMINV